MKYKIIVILKNGIKCENEYVWNISDKKEIEEILIKNLEENSNSFYLKDDNRFDVYIKEEITHISIEYID